MESDIMESSIMESDINWLDLPDKTWELIFSNLNKRHLLKTSATCKKFNDVFSTSQHLIKNFRLRIGKRILYHSGFNNALELECANLKSIGELKLMKECLQMSKRKYDSIMICALTNRKTKNNIVDVIVDILIQFARSVEQIIFHNAVLQEDGFFKIIQTMKNLKVLEFEGYLCSICQPEAVMEVVRSDTLPSINKISIKTVEERFSFQKLHLFDYVTTLEVEGCDRDYKTFDSFLLIQQQLKVLYLSNLQSLFKTENINFTLEELTLHKVYWNENEIAMKFFRTQTNLKKVTLYLQNFIFNRLDKKKWYNELLMHLFGNNLHLRTVKLSSCQYNITDFSFLEGIVNPSVENLNLNINRSQNAAELVATLIKLFPNVKNLTYTVRNGLDHGLDQIHNWKSLESLNCNLEDINEFYNNIDSWEKLTTCTISYSYEDCLRKPKMMEFLTNHQNIKHFSLNPRFNTTVPDEILSSIVNTLKSLETLICNGKSVPCNQ